MKRRVIQRRVVVVLLLLLVGGAIVNVAVAWGFSCRPTPITSLARSHNNGCQLDEDVTIADANWLAEAGRSQEMSGRPVSYYAIASHVRKFGSMYSKYRSPSSPYLSVFEGRFGWPFLSLAGGTYTRFPSSADQGYSFESTCVWDVAILKRPRIDPRYRCSLPLLPMWPGFAINTIVYAAILWVVFFVPGKARQMLRCRRGQCSACAYPIGSSEVCTECGKPVNQRNAESRNWRKRRRVIQLVLLLIAGAIVNVSVAWGCAAWTRVPPWHQSVVSNEDADAMWARYAPTHWSNTSFNRGRLGEMNAFGYRMQETIWRNPILETGGRSLYQIEVGLPMRSLRAGAWEDPRVGLVFVGGIMATNRVLPWRPIWPGFAINTIFYAAILWLLFFATGALRRTVRRRRGLCPACAYPVGTSPVCTECGKPLKTPRAESQIAESPE